MMREIRWFIYRLLWKFGINWWNIRPRPRTRKSKNCSSAVLPGQFANNPNSELFIRRDKDHPAREWQWSYKKLEELVDKGVTRPFDAREMRMFKDRKAYYERKYGVI